MKRSFGYIVSATLLACSSGAPTTSPPLPIHDAPTASTSAPPAEPPPTDPPPTTPPPDPTPTDAGPACAPGKVDLDGNPANGCEATDILGTATFTSPDGAKFAKNVSEVRSDGTTVSGLEITAYTTFNHPIVLAPVAGLTSDDYVVDATVLALADNAEFGVCFRAATDGTNALVGSIYGTDHMPYVGSFDDKTSWGPKWVSSAATFAIRSGHEYDVHVVLKGSTLDATFTDAASRAAVMFTGSVGTHTTGRTVGFYIYPFQRVALLEKLLVSPAP